MISVSTTRSLTRSTLDISVGADRALRPGTNGGSLSITASVFIVVGAAGEVGKGLRLLKVLKGALEGLEDLLEDVSRLELVLENIRNTAIGPPANLSAIETLLEKAKERLAELDSLIQYSLTEARGDRKVDRWQWLSKRGAVERRRRQLDGIRKDLTLLISTNGSYISPRARRRMS